MCVVCVLCVFCVCFVWCVMCVVRCALCVGVVVVVAVVLVGVTPAAFLLGSVVAENRQIGGNFAYFCISRSKKHRKYQ